MSNSTPHNSVQITTSPHIWSLKRCEWHKTQPKNAFDIKTHACFLDACMYLFKILNF